jgi:type I restriction enzyme M protein
LILKKLYDWVSEQLTRYLNGEKRGLVAKVENLWDKYAVSSQEMESQREQTLGQLNEFLVKLGYRD